MELPLELALNQEAVFVINTKDQVLYQGTDPVKLINAMNSIAELPGVIANAEDYVNMTSEWFRPLKFTAIINNERVWGRVMEFMLIGQMSIELLRYYIDTAEGSGFDRGPVTQDLVGVVE